MNIKLTLLPILLLTLTACPEPGDDTNSSSSLPKNPEEFDFLWHNGGGMLNVSFSARITNDTAHWTYDRYGHETTLGWTPSNEDIDKFYSDLRNENFDKIKSDCKGEVFDRGGNSITIEVDGEEYKIDNSGNCFIDEKSSKNYQAIMSIMHDYLDQEITKQMVEVNVIADESILNAGYLLSVQMDEGRTSFNPSKDTTEMKLLMYPGYNQFIVKMDYPDSTDYYGSPVNFAYEQLFEEIDGTVQSVLVEWADERIQLVVKN